MMINAMDCELFNERLMPYMEHETDEATRSAIERHAVTCGECGALLADLRKLRLEAANLPVLTPSRDLWTGIAARIETPVVAIGSSRDVARDRFGWMRRHGRQALIAASLVGAVGVGYLIPRPGSLDVAEGLRAGDSARPAMVPAVTPAGPDGSPTGAPIRVAGRDAQRAPSAPVRPEATGPARTGPAITGPAAAAEAPRPEMQVVLATLTADYDREIARLRLLIEERRGQMDPATAVIIQRNMAVVDTAIAESKRAIARDPNSRFLIESLNQSLQSKVELMRTAALLPSRT